MQNDDDFSKVPESERYRVIRPIQKLQEEIKNSNVIDSIIAMSEDDKLLSEGLARIEELIPGDVVVQRVQFASIIPKGKRLNSKDDVERYIEELKQSLLRAIDDKKEIIV